MTRARASQAIDELDALERVARAVVGGGITQDCRVRFARYLDLIGQWNRVQRLTGVRTRREIVSELFADALLFWPLLPPTRPLAVVDIGAGAGIPGLPLALVDSGIRLVMVEARRKRVSFLRTAIRELGLSDRAAVVEGRAEAVREVAKERAGGDFDVGIARAVGGLEDLLPVVLDYFGGPGIFIVSAPPDQKGVDEGVPMGFERRVVEYPEIGRRRAFFLGVRG